MNWNLPISITFLYPNFLWLLLLAPLFIVLGWPEARRTDRRRGWLNLIIRLVMLLILVLSLAGAQLERPVDRVTTVFVMDLSDSVSTDDQAQAENFLRAALAEMPPGDQAGVVLFGADAQVEQLPRPEKSIPALNAAPIKNATDIENALRLAIALLPNEGGGRIVLLSDGQETAGDALRLADLAAARHVEISVRPLGLANNNEAGPLPEMLVEQVAAPAQAREGQAAPVEVTIVTSAPADATLRLLVDGRPTESQVIRLNRGRNRFSFNVQLDEPGFHRFRAELEPLNGAADGRLQNNWGAAFTNVYGPPQILVVEGTPGESASLATALDAANLNSTVIEPTALPDTLTGLTAYDSIMLVNVPAEDLPTATQETLVSFVRDLGRGLIMVGGPDSYGAGGYLRTPLETALPVKMEVRDRSREPNIALVLAVDKSGSMGACHCDDPNLRQTYDRVPSGLPKIDIAKEAIFQASIVLGELDYMGVVSFDDSAHWEVETGQWIGPNELEASIGGMMANGQTNIYAGLVAAQQSLIKTPARVKHIILLTDGWSRTGAYSELIAQFAEEGITLSIVAAGGGSAEYLQQLAEDGGGKYYPAQSMNDVPQIFLKETVRAAGNYIIEEPFLPVSTVTGPTGSAASPILQGIDLASASPLLGYNGTTIKNTARLALLTPRGDPLLATWQYGLGRAVAWTSDLSGRWANSWLDWPDFAPFVAQMVDWTLPAPSTDRMAVTVSSSSEGATLTVTIPETSNRSPDGSEAPVESVTARLVSGEGEFIDAELLPIGAGRYQTRVDLPAEGVYLAQVTAYTGEQPEGESEPLPIASQTAGVVQSYSPEYATLEADLTLLNELTAATGGQTLTDPAASFAHTLTVGRQSNPIWPTLLILAALLFPIDVALRRLRLGRREWQQARNWILSRLPGSTGQTLEPVLDHSPTLQAFRQARRRTRSTAETPTTPPSVSPRPVSPPTSHGSAPVSTQPQPLESPAPAIEEPGGDGDTLSRLRAAKRRAQR